MRTSLKDRIKKLHRSESGQTSTVLALLMATSMMGFVALGVDVEYLFHERRMAQGAADAAALAAAEEMSAGNTSNELTVAKAAAKQNGFDTTLATNPATVTVSAPTSGNYSGSSSYVQAVVAQPISTFFLGVLTHKTTQTVAARAVAGGGLGSPTCICLEGTSGETLNMSNNAKLSLSGCGVTVDSSSSNAVGIQGSAALGATSLGIVSSSWTASSNVGNGGSIVSGTDVVTGIGTGCSPTLPAVPTYNSAQCGNDPIPGNGGSSYSVGPGSTGSTTQSTANGNLVCYNSLTIGSNGDTVNLNAGLYVIKNGALTFNSATATGGAGVFFYLVGTASLTIANGANVTLSSPTSGTYSGVLILQDSADTAAMSVQGGANTNLSGIIYAPSAVVTLGNGSSSTIKADIVANSMVMTGGTTLSSTPVSGLGSLSTSVAKMAE